MTAQNRSIHQIISMRQSDRGYNDKPVEKEKLMRILEAARLAPSACNAQPWKFIVIDEPKIISKIADAVSKKVSGKSHFSKQAPVHIVIVKEDEGLKSKYESLKKSKLFPLIDIGIAAEHICLSATAEELGSCMIGSFNESAVQKILSIPKSKKPVLIIILGYPTNKETRRKIRKVYGEVICFNEYMAEDVHE